MSNFTFTNCANLASRKCHHSDNLPGQRNKLDFVGLSCWVHMYDRSNVSGSNRKVSQIFNNYHLITFLHARFLSHPSAT